MSEKKRADHAEEGIEVPYERLDQDTLLRMIEEFVTRDGADWGEAGCTLADKVQQVMQQLRSKKVVIVFDHTSQTANFVVSCPPCQDSVCPGGGLDSSVLFH